jgi:crotonobetainyl-CoA:carnitine CoA-transferase CaiB-like acyl-CoA transferase
VTAAGALSGVRVLDLTRVIAGPFCTSLLADMGAEVVKVEVPRRGDDGRYGYPSVDGVPVAFLALNRDKRGITLDLRKPAGRDLLRRLAAQVDVLVENFAPGTMAEWGIGPEALCADHPRLVYAALSGFGQTGPLRARTSYDIIAQAMSGFMSLTGFADAPPTRGGGSLGDFVGGVFLALGIVCALHHRQASGRGQVVDVSNMDALFSMLDNWPTVFAATGRMPPRLGNRHPFTAPYDCFAARDGYVVIGVGNNRLFRRLMEAIGRPELGQDARFKAPAARLEHSDEIHAVVAAWVGERTVAEVEDALGPGRADVPCAPVLSVADLVTHPHLRAREMLCELPHARLGHVLVPGVPIKLSASPGRVRRLGPELGEHNREIYAGWLGLGDAEIERLAADEVI